MIQWFYQRKRYGMFENKLEWYFKIQIINLLEQQCKMMLYLA
jgi:hypothetical protein